VLIIQADKRKMYHNLNDNQYVGMVAVLLDDYTFNHGYDFQNSLEVQKEW
jgi:hypothetical protein